MKLPKGPLIAAACAVAGCIHMQRVVDRTASPEPGVGYVAALFDVDGSASAMFGLGISTAIGREYFLPFSNGPTNATGRTTEVTMIALPPGDYRVAYWATSLNSGDVHRVRHENPISQPFAVKSGQVIFLGRFLADLDVSEVDYRVSLARSTVKPQPIAVDVAWAALTGQYPGFIAAAVECVLCTAPMDGARQRASPAGPDGGDFARERQVVIHVFRSEGHFVPLAYGMDPRPRTLLTAWETFDDSEKTREVSRASWVRPMPPEGSDSFGAWFLLNDLNFKNGKVSFAIRDPERNQPPLERRFLLSDAHEVWVNDGDPKIYFSEKEARAASASR